MDVTVQREADRESRILARRKQVQERLLAKREAAAGTVGGTKDGESHEEVGKGKEQLLQTKYNLQRTKEMARKSVSSVITVSDYSESQRRSEEGHMRQWMRSRLLDEAEQSARQNASLAMRWSDLFTIDVPQELLNSIQQQEDMCHHIIDSKDKLISEIKDQLIRKDDDYVKLLKRQAEEIILLVDSMQMEHSQMHKSYSEELDEIESALLEERRDLVKANKDEIQALFEKRTRIEQDFMERYLAASENYHKQLIDLRAVDAEDFCVLKIKLETDIQNLEQHLEAMRATYQLNTEKLDYNYRVLVERDHENQSTINQQKRKISRQRDALSNLKSRYADVDRKFQDANIRLMEEYRRTTEQFKELQGKYSHFENVELTKIQDVWNMKVDELALDVKDMLLADKLIHEQQLGWKWQPPSKDVFVLGRKKEKIISKHEEEASTNESGTSVSGIEDPRNEEVDFKLKSGYYSRFIRQLTDEAGFLIDTKAKLINTSGPLEKQEYSKVLSILSALDVVDGKSFQTLVEAMDQTNTSRSTEQADLKDGIHPKLSITEDETLQKLKCFLENEGSIPGKNQVKSTRGGPRKIGISRRIIEEEKQFWFQLSNTVSNKNYRAWKNLHKNLKEYQQNLSKRSRYLKQVKSLQDQNSELRLLLNQYLASKINEDLQVPPIHVI